MLMKNDIAVVITTINPPTEALLTWAGKFHTIVVPDKKTPITTFQSSPVSLLPLNEIYGLKQLPWNHYCRKNLGYLHAAHKGFSYILDTDDDTFYDGVRHPLEFGNKVHFATSESSFVNVYKLRYNKKIIWPRGFPLDSLQALPMRNTSKQDEHRYDIVQYLINGDTDVDAIHRLVFGVSDINFESSGNIDIIPPGYICPFNSQLTLFGKEVFPTLYLPCTVTFRFTDILRGIIAKRVLDASGLTLAFADSIGFQVRNQHNYMDDFHSEIPCYTQTRLAWDSLGELNGNSIVANMRLAYQILCEKGIVQKLEAEILDKWLSAMPNCGGQA